LICKRINFSFKSIGTVSGRAGEHLPQPDSPFPDRRKFGVFPEAQHRLACGQVFNIQIQMIAGFDRRDFMGQAGLNFPSPISSRRAIKAVRSGYSAPVKSNWKSSKTALGSFPPVAQYSPAYPAANCLSLSTTN
jgi:hypothetical protein